VEPPDPLDPPDPPAPPVPGVVSSSPQAPTKNAGAKIEPASTKEILAIFTIVISPFRPPRASKPSKQGTPSTTRWKEGKPAFCAWCAPLPTVDPSRKTAPEQGMNVFVTAVDRVGRSRSDA
jgi:hypothetical protein